MLYGGFPTLLSTVWETEDKYRGQGRTTRTTADGFSSFYLSSPWGLSGDRGGREMRKSCQRQATQQFQLCISVHLSDPSASFLQCLCLIFLHIPFSAAPSHLGSPSRGLWSWEYGPSTFLSPGWVSKLLYWEEECDGLCVFPLPIAIRSSNQGDTAKPKPRSPVHLLTCLQFFVVFTCFLGLLKQQNKSSYKVAAARHQPRI